MTRFARPLRRRIGLAALVLGLAAGRQAAAGPPYITDDPEPTDDGHWEIYAFVNGARASGETAGAGGLDFNYGGAPDLQLTAVLPFEYDASGTGLGDIEMAAKYKIVHQDGPVGLDIAVFPRVFLPTAESRGHGDHKVSLLLPVWAGKDIGDWSLFGGAGYTINRGPDARDFWAGGLVVTRKLTERLTMGAEVYSQGAEDRDGRRFTGMTLGMTWQFAGHWSLLAAGGPGLENTRDGGRYAFYAALLANF